MAGGVGAEWSNDEFGFESELEGDELIRPPFSMIAVIGGLTLISALFFVGSSSVGYLMSVFASIAGGFTALLDQKRRGSSNYVSYDSFAVLLRLARLLVLFIAVAHIARLAVDVARGGSIF